MTYNEDSFKNCYFNPLSKEEMIRKYTVFQDIADIEWLDDKDLDALIRYTIIMYDPNSAVVKNERDINHRRNIAFELANITDEDLMTKICDHSHEYIVDLVCKYLIRFPKSKEWATICALEYTFWESIRKLFEPISGKDTKGQLESVQKKSAIKDEIDKDIDRLENYYNKFFGGDKEIEKKAKSRYRPEDIHKSLNGV